MKTTYLIDHIKTEDINELSIQLNAMHEVSHIKITKDTITFECIHPESVQNFLTDKEYVLKEIVNKRKREYQTPVEKTTHYYMFSHLELEEDAKAIAEVLSKYSIYENVQIDFQNKMLTLVTSSQNNLKRIRRIVENVNPIIKVESWKKPFRSQDLFNERYIQAYLRIAVLVVGVAIGIVTHKDTSFMTYLGWFIATLVINEINIKDAIRDIKYRNYLSENVIYFVACIGGWVYGAFLEALIVSIIYQIGKVVIAIVTHWCLTRIDTLITKEYVGKRVLKDGTEEIVPLDEFDIGDIIAVEQGETIPLGGKIIEGEAKLDVYAIDGKDVVQDAYIGQEVYSGTVVSAGSLKIKTTALFEQSALSKVLEVAKTAPTTSSKIEKVIEIVSKYYTQAIIVLGFVCCIVLPIINFKDNFAYIYLGVIMLTVSGSFAYVQGAAYTLLAGVAKALSKKISIKENSGLDDLNTCVTIIYDRFDGVETTQDELDLFERIKKMHKKIVIFNDGPVDLENTEYEIYNNLSVEEKLEVMDRLSIAGPVAYIGDCDKDIALLQKATVAISRGGVHNRRVRDNSDIILTNSNFDTIIDLIRIARKQRSINIENTFIGILVSLIVIIVATAHIMPWYLASIIYILESLCVMLNATRMVMMK